jgi:hypothetical protein
MKSIITNSWYIFISEEPSESDVKEDSDDVFG